MQTKIKVNPKVTKVLNHLNRGIENWGSVTSTDFQLFCREFKSMLTSELEKVGGIDYKQNNGHYYISISDVRHFKVDNILIRTAKDYRDFTGGTNHYINIESGMLTKYFNK